MRELRKKQFLVLTLLILFMGWAGWFTLNNFFSDQLFSGYVILPVLYYAAGLLLIEVLYRVDKSKPLKLARTYLVMHLLKFVIFGALALFFILALGVKTKAFILVYALYYLVFIVFETLMYYSVEKQIKKMN
ncbi:MAG: hypothetical protein ACOYM7_02455 [Paludibacter sp.]